MSKEADAKSSAEAMGNVEQFARAQERERIVALIEVMQADCRCGNVDPGSIITAIRALK